MADLLKQVAPGASRVGWFDVPGIEVPEVAEVWAQKENGAARSRGLAIHRVFVRGPNDLTQAFDDLRRQGVDAVVVPNSSLLNSLGVQIASLALKHRLPTIGSPLFARAGGLLAYGPDGADLYRRAAGYVDRILKGSAPADLPYGRTFEVRDGREFEGRTLSRIDNSARAPRASRPDH
jgi:putative ABC transport system substrate-binding protein